MSIKILNGGMLSTIQDLGRFGVMKNGFTQSGAMDSRSMKTANRLVGNCLACAVVEMTVTGITAQFDRDYIIALSGGRFNAKINDSKIRTNKAYRVKSGDVLTVGSAEAGVRAYLAVSGGIRADIVMGSRSTNLKSSIGGYYGRQLKAGDVLETDNYNFAIDNIDDWQIDETQLSGNITVRAVLGPQDYMFTDDDIKLFFNQEYTVTTQADRMGIRLDGEPLTGKDGMDIISDGIVFGSVQIPKNGKPIVLMADHQTTGGYAKIATVISTDLPLLAQAKPNDKIHFRQITAKQAERLAKAEKKYFDRLFFF